MPKAAIESDLRQSLPFERLENCAEEKVNEYHLSLGVSLTEMR